MARKIKNRSPKKIISVFYEGESEREYIKEIGKIFSDVCAIHPYTTKGTFLKAKNILANDPKYKKEIGGIDEVWFFFDTESEIRDKWDEYQKIITSFENKKKTVRLLMTRCCVEYWFLLHYTKCAPVMKTPADKENQLKRLKTFVSSYEKGDNQSINQIAKNYEMAIVNGKWSLSQIDDLSNLKGRNKDKFLFQSEYTFTTVHEALEYLQSIIKV